MSFVEEQHTICTTWVICSWSHHLQSSSSFLIICLLVAMDSGNSGSMQSSSGGDEEYDSRSDSISAFINSSTTPPPPSQHQNPSQFDPLSNFLDSFARSPAPPTMKSVLNLDSTVWTRGQQYSGPNCTDMGRGVLGSSSLTSPISVFDRSSFPTTANVNPSMQLPLGSENGGRLQPSNDQQQNVSSRNPKKRSRASRRAPTTVLTTDTSNFRAMVQEFTGIPAPPFSSSAFPRARIDLFNSASSMRSALSNPPALPPYLLRPFAQKLQQQHLLQSSIFGSFPPTTSSISSAMLDVVTSANTNTASINTSDVSSTTGTAAATSTNNFQLPCDLGLLKQHPNLLNPSFTFQSQTTPKYPFSSSVPVPALGAKSQPTQVIPSAGSHLKMGLLPLDEFGVSPGHVSSQQLGTLTGLVGSDAMSLRGNDPASWGDGVGSNYGNSHRVSSCKMNYNTGPSTDFHSEKGSENVSSRGEGMVDSWICSTD